MGQEIVKVPDIGDASDVEVIEISVAVGDTIGIDDTLIVLESDKASMEIPSPSAGVVTSIAVTTGDKVSQDDDILVLETGDSDVVVEVEESTSDISDKEDTSDADTTTEEEQNDFGKDIAATSVISVVVPDIGDASDVEVIEIPVAIGDAVEVDDSLIVLESDKASMEIPSPQAGIIKSLSVNTGDKVSEGAAILELEVQGGSPVKEKQSEKKLTIPAKALDEDKPSVSKPVAPISTNEQPLPSSSRLVYAGPAVRMLARDFGVDLSQVKATGPRGRTLKEDVHVFVKNALQGNKSGERSGLGIPSVPDIDFSAFGGVDIVDMSRVQKLTAKAMHRSWLNVPHVTHFDEADITDLEEFRALKKKPAQERNLKLTPLPFLLKACAAALRQYPQFNVSLVSSGEQLIQKHYCHIGIAMNTPAGLMVPVIRDVDKKGIWELAEEATELGVRGQKGQLKKADLQGGCFTISSLGAIGGTGFTPIINTPEVAILGVSRTQIKPVFVEGEAGFVPRKMLPVTLSYDHRAINGVDAGQFVTFITQVLSDIRKLVM